MGDSLRHRFIWIILVTAIVVPIGAAAKSPLLQWREPIYIAAGFSGIVALILLLCQPLLAGGYLSGLSHVRSLRLHRWTGALLLIAIVLHVAGLWLTSPPDVIDALLFKSPTPFSIWGVIAMWCVFATAALTIFRRRLKLNRSTWRLFHKTLAVVIVAGTVIHAMLIEGTMEIFSKAALCGIVAATTLVVIAVTSGTK